jgi:soluble lytic murein transglycosylase-like protein
MAANQQFFNQLVNPAAVKYQAAQVGLPIGTSYPSQDEQGKLAKFMNIAGYLGDFVGGVSQGGRGTPGGLIALGNMSNRYNTQQFNAHQQQLEQEAQAREQQARMENAQMAQMMAQAQGYTLPEGFGEGGLNMDPAQVQARLGYVGDVLGNQAFQGLARGEGLAPKPGANLNEQMLQAFFNRQATNADNIATNPMAAKAAAAGIGAAGTVVGGGNLPTVAVAGGGGAAPVSYGAPTVKVGKNVARWTPQVTQIASKYGVDPNLVLAVMQQESGGNPTIGSSAGSRGLMQLMPATAKELGVKNITDPVQNLEGGVKYLKQQLDRFGGDVDKALAAYNAGPGAVQKYGGVPPYKETQGYVKAIRSTYGGGNAAVSQGGASGGVVVNAGGGATIQGGNRNPLAVLEAYNNSPQLRQAALNNPYQTGIANPATIIDAVRAGGALGGGNRDAAVSLTNNTQSNATSLANAQLSADTSIQNTNTQAQVSRDNSVADNAAADKRAERAYQAALEQQRKDQVEEAKAQRKEILKPLDDQIAQLNKIINDPKTSSNNRGAAKQSVQVLQGERQAILRNQGGASGGAGKVDRTLWDGGKKVKE